MTSAMEAREHPILFSGAMVRALLDGSKTQTRRVVKSQPSAAVTDVIRNEREFVSAYQNRMAIKPCEYATRCPYGQPGERLWVRETHWVDRREPTDCVIYAADNARHHKYRLRASVETCGDGMCNDYLAAHEFWKQRPSIFMSRWASRLTLEITEVRVQRLHDITDADAIAEGVAHGVGANFLWIGGRAVNKYRTLWDELNAKRGYAWATSPWVWALTFAVVRS